MKLIIYKIYNLFLWFLYLICRKFIKLYIIKKILNIHNRLLIILFCSLNERNAIANETNIIQFRVQDACNVSIRNSRLYESSIYIHTLYFFTFLKYFFYYFNICYNYIYFRCIFSIYKFISKSNKLYIFICDTNRVCKRLEFVWFLFFSLYIFSFFW